MKEPERTLRGLISFSCYGLESWQRVEGITAGKKRMEERVLTVCSELENGCRTSAGTLRVPLTGARGEESLFCAAVTGHQEESIA